MEKIMDNYLIEARCLEQMNLNSEALAHCESAFLMLTRKNIWNPNLGVYLVEIVKITFKTVVKELTHVKKCNLYYILDLIHVSFQASEAATDSFFIEKLKAKCQYHDNTTNFINEIVKVFLMFDKEFYVGKLVNTTFSKFVAQTSFEQVKNLMEDMKMVYFCVGPDFLLDQIKPIS